MTDFTIWFKCGALAHVTAASLEDALGILGRRACDVKRASADKRERYE